jgi:hypothetical protein
MTMFQLNISHGACLLWLRLASLATITTGIIASLASHPNGDLIWRVLFDLLKGFDLQRATSLRRDVSRFERSDLKDWIRMIYLTSPNRGRYAPQCKNF